MIPRAVFDTSVPVSGLRSRSGASNALLALVGKERFQLVASPAVFLEYEQTLKREEHMSIHGLTFDQVDAFLMEIRRYIEPARIYYRWRPQLQDEKDEMILEAACNGRADVIVTHNIRDFVTIPKRFGIEVLSPAQFLREVRL